MNYEQDDSKWNELMIEEGRATYDLEERLLEFSVQCIRLSRKKYLMKQTNLFVYL